MHRREELLEDLFGTLSRLGIEPIGAESIHDTVGVQPREVDPHEAEDEFADLVLPVARSA